MNIYNLDSELKFVNQIGYTLNVDEKIRLELALQKINKEKKFDEVKFWGKIQGSKKDYFIAMCLEFKNKYQFCSKTFYYANNDFEFQELPELLCEYKDEVEKFRQMMTGESESILIEKGVEQEGEEEQQQQQIDEEGEENQQQEQVEIDSDEELQVKVVSKSFREVDRLSYVVRAIENDCQAVPTAAYQMTITHTIKHNPYYTPPTQSSINHFYHFRPPQNVNKQEEMKEDEVIFSDSFLDPIVLDEPKGCWSLQEKGEIVSARNLSWLGYIAYYQNNSSVYGGVYFGNGLKNSDLPFLLSQLWQILPDILDETRHEKGFVEIYQQLSRIHDLERNLKEDRNKLQLDYLVLIKERNLYFEKLKMVQQFIEEQHYTQDPLVQDIHQIINNLGKQTRTNQQ